jgi:DNA integrity scanning protein DisA with diadenylate cyclase activity
VRETILIGLISGKDCCQEIKKRMVLRLMLNRMIRIAVVIAVWLSLQTIQFMMQQLSKSNLMRKNVILVTLILSLRRLENCNKTNHTNLTKS